MYRTVKKPLIVIIIAAAVAVAIVLVVIMPGIGDISNKPPGIGSFGKKPLPNLQASEIAYIDIQIEDGGNEATRVEDPQQIQEIVNAMHAISLEEKLKDKDYIAKSAVGYYIHLENGKTEEIAIDGALYYARINGEYYKLFPDRVGEIYRLGYKILKRGIYEPDSFFLSTASGGGDTGDVLHIWKENGKTYFECSYFPADIFTEVEDVILDDLVQFIRANKIDEWDGFFENPENNDGGGFSLHMEYGDMSLHAYGYGYGAEYRPSGYKEGYSILRDFLMGYYQSIPMPMLDPVSVYRIDLPVGDNDIQFIYGPNGNLENVSVLYKQGTSVSTVYDFSKIDVILDDNLAKQLRNRVLGFEIINRDSPILKEQNSENILLIYRGIKIDNHICYATTTSKELTILNKMALEVLGLPVGYDWNMLFDESAGVPPVRAHYDEKTRTLLVIEDDNIGTIRLTIPEAYDSYNDDTRFREGTLKAISIVKETRGNLFVTIWDPHEDMLLDFTKEILDESSGYEKKTIGKNEWLFTVGIGGVEIYYIIRANYILSVRSSEIEDIYKKAALEMIASIEINR